MSADEEIARCESTLNHLAQFSTLSSELFSNMIADVAYILQQLKDKDKVIEALEKEKKERDDLLQVLANGSALLLETKEKLGTTTDQGARMKRQKTTRDYNEQHQTEEILKLKAMIYALATDKFKLQNDLDAAKYKTNAVETEYTSYKHVADQAMKTLEAKLEASKSQNDTDASTRTLTRLEEELAQKNKALEAMTVELGLLNVQKANLTNNLATAKKDLAFLKIGYARTAEKFMHSKKPYSEAEMTEARNQTSRLRGQIEDLKKEITNLETRLDEANAINESLEKDAKEMMSSHQERIEVLQAELERSHEGTVQNYTLCATLRAQLAGCRSEFIKLDRENISLRGQLGEWCFDEASNAETLGLDTLAKCIIVLAKTIYSTGGTFTNDHDQDVEMCYSKVQAAIEKLKVVKILGQEVFAALNQRFNREQVAAWVKGIYQIQQQEYFTGDLQLDFHVFDLATFAKVSSDVVEAIKPYAAAKVKEPGIRT
jgi:chromosome segregation ATPase